MAYASDVGFLIAENKRRPSKTPEGDIAKWIEGRRVLPSSTPFPGFWRNERTPYLVEPMNCMSPTSPVQRIAIMKGAQLGLTAAAENVIAYWMDEFPAEILFISATDRLLEKWAVKRLEPLIDSCGFRDKIFAQTKNTKSRRSGDKILYKEYVGGSLDMASAQSAPGLRSDSKRILIRDEIDGAPAHLKTGEGNWLNVSLARTEAFGDRRKIMDFSTPTTEEASLIKGAYEAGDQCKFFVPCPFCGKHQELEWGDEKTQHGIKAETKAGKVISVCYQCAHCREGIYNHHKTKMLRGGRWVPTAQTTDDLMRSFHISTLYSPVGMSTWMSLYKRWQDAHGSGDPDDVRSFVNLYLGLPYRETGERPKIDKVIELRGGYRHKTVPYGVLYLTIGIDVQAGSSRDSGNPARLEMEVCGHGAGFRTWSIEYRRFEGEIEDHSDGAWLLLEEWARETKMAYSRSDGMVFTPTLIFIDSGDGNMTDTVYRFCSGWGSTFPSKGWGWLPEGKREEGVDRQARANFRRYKLAKVGGGDYIYEIATNHYKHHLYKNLKIERKDTGRQRPGFCDFPIDYGEKYFRMLTAEEKRKDGTFYCPSGRRNESLDTRVMNLCASDVYLDSEVMRVKAKAMKEGATKDQVQVLGHRHVLEYLQKTVAPLMVDVVGKQE